MAIAIKVRGHFEWWIKKKILTLTSWNTELVGSKSVVDVRNKRNQKIRVNFTVDEN